MALLVVGGQSKHVGKTTLICNLVRRFSDVRWIAVKFSSHEHKPEHCKLVARGSGWSIWEQLPNFRVGDTARFLQAGASRSLLVIAEKEDSFAQGFSRLQQEFGSRGDVIVESSRAALHMKPDLSLLVVDASDKEFKASAKSHLQIADALVVRRASDDAGVSHMEIPIFCSLPDSVDDALASLVSKTVAKNSRAI